MTKQKNNKKYVYLGDVDSINIELVIKSFSFLKNKTKYIILCNKSDFIKNSFFKRYTLEINEILDPISFFNYKKNKLNIFNIDDISKKKYLNLLNQIKIANNLSNITKYDLVTLPINKAIFKKNINFVGMTEHLSELNKKPTLMLMCGDKFSIIPLSTHINLKNVYKYINIKDVDNFLKTVFYNIKKARYKLNFNKIKFLCYNPHCGEEGTLGKEDILIKKLLVQNYKKVEGPYSADSAFLNIKINTLYLSTYHDQALIPFKILNNNSINITLGLDYRRLSPAHGTAKDIKQKFIANNSSYLQCLLA